MAKEDKRRLNQRILTGVFLSALVLVSYWGVQGHDFINYDDPAYVTKNPHLARGLDGEGLIWAWTSTAVSNWHPLTWVSLLLDRKLYGGNPAGYHWTNVILHLLATLVLFVSLERMTGRVFCSGLVAGLFAVHPLHVESVAWIAERKDVLSGLFWMLGLWGYACYVQRPGLIRYGWVVLFFALGLLSKPMVVTFPFVLLLLDWWPLRRIRLGAVPSEGEGGHHAEGRESRSRGIRGSGVPFSRLILEKVPLLVLSAGGCLVTFVVQDAAGAVDSLQNLPLADRLANIVVSYANYVVKAVLPVRLSVFYPRPAAWPPLEVILSLGLVVLVTLFVLIQARRRPYLAVGWFWYLGTLVPVIGLVQVGAQAMADRYTYLPLCGIFLMVVWYGHEGMGRWPRRAGVFGGLLAMGGLAVLVAMTRTQVGYWKESSTLFEHALQVTERNHQAHKGLADALRTGGQYAEAIDHYREAIRITPLDAAAFNNLGLAEMELGRHEAAEASFAAALEIKPEDGDVRVSRGELFARRGMVGEAIAEYRIALKKKPHDAALRNNLGVALVRQGDPEGGMTQFREAIRLDPEHAGAHANLGLVLMGLGEDEEAIRSFREAVRLQPDYVQAHEMLALLLERRGRPGESAYHRREAQRTARDTPKGGKTPGNRLRGE